MKLLMRKMRFFNPKRYIDGLRREMLALFCRRDALLQPKSPIISFSFDDFPCSALTVGGTILQAYGARGTYYVASGLINSVNMQGVHFCEHDLKALMAEGHEVGTHTYNHTSIHAVTLESYTADVVKGNAFVQEVTKKHSKLNFSYPFGHVTLAAKQVAGELNSSCRSTFSGINHGRIDLNLLRANRLYSSMTDLKTINKLIRINSEIGGWLIFYTHDVRDKPSQYGCTPRFFEEVVKEAAKSKARILTVESVLAEIHSDLTSKALKISST